MINVSHGNRIAESGSFIAKLFNIYHMCRSKGVMNSQLRNGKLTNVIELHERNSVDKSLQTSSILGLHPSSLQALANFNRAMDKAQTEEYGWAAVPRGRSNVPSNDNVNTATTTVEFEAIWPTTEVVKKAKEWVKTRLSKETFDHSLRVYCYGMSIKVLEQQPVMYCLIIPCVGRPHDGNPALPVLDLNS